MFETAELRNETLHELGSLYHKQRNFRAARRVLGKYTTCTPKPTLTRELCSMLGLSCTAMGDILDGVSWYKKAITLDAGYKEAWLNMFHAYKEGGHVRAFQLVQYPALPAKLCDLDMLRALRCAHCCCNTQAPGTAAHVAARVAGRWSGSAGGGGGEGVQPDREARQA